MTIPQRGIWKNGVLKMVLQEHQIRQHVGSLQKFITNPVAVLTPPKDVHSNSHTPSSLPGMTRPGPRAPRATSASDVQTAITRSQQRFIPGTASASAPSAISAGRSAVKGRQ